VDLRIRKAQDEDTATLYAIDQSCFGPGIAWSRAELFYFLKHPRNFSLVAEDEQAAIVGFAVAGLRRGRGELAGHLITIDVRAAERRRGVGQALLAATEERLRARNAGSIELEVAVDNRAALEFYERQGFVRTGRIPGYYLGRIDALTMEKAL
jgi:[ribosomal protein S18]-alanine N-acetyltransferase